MITFNCPACGKRFHVKDELAGKNARCPGCQKVLTIPQVAQPEEIPMSSVRKNVQPPDPPHPTYIPPQQPQAPSSIRNKGVSGSLIQCPDCGQAVSARAETCPKCGYPIAGGGSTQAHGGKVQTIEKTSKIFKLQELLAVFLILSCLIIFFMGSSFGISVSGNGLIFCVLGVVVGLVWFVIIRFLVWWHHG